MYDKCHIEGYFLNDKMIYIESENKYGKSNYV